MANAEPRTGKPYVASEVQQVIASEPDTATQRVSRAIKSSMVTRLIPELRTMRRRLKVTHAVREFIEPLVFPG
jgi:hypothetical protein